MRNFIVWGNLQTYYIKLMILKKKNRKKIKILNSEKYV